MAWYGMIERHIKLLLIIRHIRYYFFIILLIQFIFSFLVVTNWSHWNCTLSIIYLQAIQCIYVKQTKWRWYNECILIIHLIDFFPHTQYIIWLWKENFQVKMQNANNNKWITTTTSIISSIITLVALLYWIVFLQMTAI